MADQDKTKVQLIEELQTLRAQLALRAHPAPVPQTMDERTEPVQTSDPLRTSEARYHRLFNELPIGLFRTTPEGQFLDVNPALVKMFRYPDPATLLATNANQLYVDPVQRQQWQTITAEDGVVSAYLVRLRRYDGTAFWGEGYIHIAQDDNEQPCYEGVLKDVSERVQFEEKTRQIRQQLQDMFDHTPAAVYLKDMSGHFIFVNRVVHERMGFPASYILGKTLGDIYPELRGGPIERWEIHEKQVLERGEAMTFEEIGRTTGRAYLVTKFLLYDSDGIPYALCNSSLDITERKHAEETALKAAQQFQDMFDNTLAVVYARDLEGRFIFANRTWTQNTGFSVEDTLGKTLAELFPDYEYTQWDPTERQVLESGKAITIEEIGHTTGKVFLATKFLLREADGTPYALCNSSADISDRVEAENALQSYATRLEMLRKIDQGILAAQTPKAIVQGALAQLRELICCEHVTLDIFDHESGEHILFALDTQVESTMKIGDRYALDACWMEVFRQGKSYIIEDLRVYPLFLPALQAMLDSGLLSLIAIPLQVKDDILGSLNLMSTEAQAFDDDCVEIAREVANQLAIALRQAHLYEQVLHHAEELEQRVAERTAELEMANQELWVLTRMKDEFVSNVSHELRTPITNMLLQIHLSTKTTTGQQERLNILYRETKRLEDLIESLLFLSRLDQDRVTIEFEEIDLNDLVGNLVQDRESLGLEQGLQLSFMPAVDCPLVIGNTRLVGQVLSILLTNAINYTPQGGQIQTEIVYSDRWAGFCVSDTGPGIPPDEHDQLFLRFFRGSVGINSGKSGTGLGLSIAREIINRHDGRIEVESEGIPGQGTTFKVWLPVERENT